jgi:hypothetical protein
MRLKGEAADLNYNRAAWTVLLSHGTIVKAHGKEHVLFCNEFSCAQPIPNVILIAA